MTKSLHKGFNIFLLLFLLAFTQEAVAGSKPRPEYLPDEVLVKFREGVAAEAVDSVVGRINGTVIKKYRLTPGLLRVRVPEGSVEWAVKFLKTLPEVEYAEPNFLRYPDLTPNDPQFSSLWGLHNTGQTGGTADADIDAPEAWNVTTGSSSVVVAVIDSGADWNHQDLSQNIFVNPGEIAGNSIDDDGNGFVDDVRGWDFAHNDNDPSDSDATCGGHGTHVSGTIGARGNNGTGVTGVNWNVKIMPLKVFRTYFLVFCSASSTDIIDAIEYYSMMGVRASNNSYGSYTYSQAESDAIRASRSTFVAAAGNDGLNTDVNPHYPSSYNLPNIISVAATDHNDSKASFSNYGATSVDLGAPGVNILSTTPGNTYTSYSGTSMAGPHVAGSAALQMADDPSLTDNEVRWRLLHGVDPTGLTVSTGGRLNINNTLLLPGPSVQIDVIPTGPTTIARGGAATYTVSLHNSGASAATVNASVIAVHPSGVETVLASGTVNVPAGATLSQNFTQTVPLGVATGEYLLSGRAEVTNVSYDEDIAVYNITP